MARPGCRRPAPKCCLTGRSAAPTSTRPPIAGPDYGSRSRTARWPRWPARPGSPIQRTLAAFAASAHRGDQLDLLTAWLDGNRAPDELAVDGELRARALFTLSARGRARQADIDALPELDHANGARYRAMCLAVRPDPQTPASPAACPGTSRSVCAPHRYLRVAARPAPA